MEFVLELARVAAVGNIAGAVPRARVVTGVGAWSGACARVLALALELDLPLEPEPLRA